MLLGPPSFPEEGPKKPCQHHAGRSCSHLAGEGSWTSWLFMVGSKAGFPLGELLYPESLFESRGRPGNRTRLADKVFTAAFGTGVQ